MPGAAAVYCRISSDPEGRRLGVARQEKDCRQLAERKGWPVAEVYVDNDVSAASGATRPEYQRMLSAIEAGDHDAVVCWDADRLHRRPIELEEFFAVCDKAGLRHLATVGGDLDLATGEGVMVARIKGAVAAEEVRKLKARVRRKKLELAEAGRPAGGGRRAFGWERDGKTVCDVEADAIRRWAARLLAGESLAGIVRDLNQNGPLPVGGRIWRTNAVHKVLTSPRVAGLRQHQGVVVAEAEWPAILDHSTWEQVRVLLQDPARRTNQSARRYLLTGLLRCGRCGHHLAGKPHRTGIGGYQCSPLQGGCGLSVVATPLEEYVLGRVFDHIGRPGFGAAVARRIDGNPPDDALTEIGAVEAKLADLARQWASDEIDSGSWAAARQALEARLAAARRRLLRTTAAGRLRNVDVKLPERWESMTIEEQRAALANVIERIDVRPPIVRGRGYFDRERVRRGIVWRD